jgi:hypothetical protein
MRGAEALDEVPNRAEGFYWVVLGQNLREIAHWEWGSGGSPATPSAGKPEAVTVVRGRLIFRPRTATDSTLVTSAIRLKA